MAIHNKSALVGGVRPKPERTFLHIYGLFQGLAGALLAAVPGGGPRDMLITASTWLFFFCMLMALARAVLFSRGFADFVLCLCAALEFGLFSWCFSTPDLSFANGYRPLVCFAMLFAGMAQILAFAQIMDRVRLPLLVVGGLFSGVLAILLLLDIPSDSALELYLFPGLADILQGLCCLDEARHIRMRMEYFRM